MNDDQALEKENHNTTNPNNVIAALVVTVFSWLVFPEAMVLFIGLGFDILVLLLIQYILVMIPFLIFASSEVSKYNQFNIRNKDNKQSLFRYLGFSDKINSKIILQASLLGGSLFFVALIVIIFYITLFGTPPIPSNGISDVTVAPTIDALLLRVLFIFVVNSAVEELFFRRFLQRILTESTNFTVGILASSAVFGILHIGTSPVTALNAFVIGIILGLAYKRTNSLYTSWIAHGVYNSILIVLSFVLSFLFMINPFLL
ncbi:MAG: CPBP family intramembrane glutamic endopeptidase [Candidatus Ranarchaeia archaeon]